MREIKFYQPREGKPPGSRTVDFETRQISLYSSYNSLWREYMEVRDLLDRLLNEQIQQLEQLVLEAKQIKLHLASMSDEPISEDSVEAE